MSHPIYLLKNRQWSRLVSSKRFNIVRKGSGTAKSKNDQIHDRPPKYSRALRIRRKRMRVRTSKKLYLATLINFSVWFCARFSLAISERVYRWKWRTFSKPGSSKQWQQNKQSGHKKLGFKVWKSEGISWFNSKHNVECYNQKYDFLCRHFVYTNFTVSTCFIPPRQLSLIINTGTGKLPVTVLTM